MSYIQELTAKLSQKVPFKWRVQGANKKKDKVQLTAYIDARQVQDLLDEHCEHGWSSAFKEVAGGVFCSIQIHGPNGESWVREDAGNRVENDTDDQMFEQGFKAAASDAFKRAAVQFGIGRFLYDIEKVWLPCNEYRQPLNERKEVIWDITEHMNSLRAPAGKKKPSVTPPAAAPAVTTPPVAPPEQSIDPVSPEEPVKLPALDQKAYDNMVKAITKGDTERVKKAMDNYTLTLQQKTVLNALLNNSK